MCRQLFENPVSNATISASFHTSMAQRLLAVGQVPFIRKSVISDLGSNDCYFFAKYLLITAAK